VATAKNSNRAVSDILEISNSYEAFCIDEAADYLYQQLTKKSLPQNQDKPKLTGNKFMQTLAVWKRK